MKQKLLALSIAALSGAAFAGTVTTEGDDLVIGSKGDLSIATKDGDFSFAIDGRMMWDTDYYSGVHHNSSSHSDPGSNAFGSELRRSRLAFKGTVYSDWHYKFQYTFNANSGEKNQLEDAYIKYTGWDFADITVGKYKFPFGLEELVSSKHISTIERSAMVEFVRAGRSEQNIQLSNGGKNYSWAFGLYEGEQDENGSELYNLVGRATFAPIVTDNQVFHLGAAVFKSDIDDANPVEVKFTERLSVHTADKINLANTLNANDHIQYGLEAAWMTGPFSLQSEYVSSTWEDDTNEVEYSGYYVQGTWTLTGESRSYKAKKGIFDKISPKGANGAVELVAKFEHGEIDDDRTGAVENAFDNVTVGVNWYVNKNVRLSANYIMTELDEDDANGEDDGNAFSTRLQLIW
ncbi:phosphate-selective porin OprO/OprP [Litorivivens lipolytica]|uniref:Phosphate-selective porin OprO/OprP n=1 Tax=Litorivivens lipolytica TaxID=1524264 RepID=A0A7W4W2C0_9GAMM|nr:porin [Litorivivens lipolytica]MBB3046020.1 phosphate-selective porin OprO/OprP [Litorivivens lipolytica]